MSGRYGRIEKMEIEKLREMRGRIEVVLWMRIDEELISWTTFATES